MNALNSYLIFKIFKLKDMLYKAVARKNVLEWKKNWDEKNEKNGNR